MCLTAVVVEGVRADFLGPSTIYDVCVYFSFICFVSAFTLGALRSPILTLPFALAAAFLIPHELCAMSIGVLPGLSIMPSWMLGSLCHVPGRMLGRPARSEIGFGSDACDERSRDRLH
jgi:hypothetical protein